MMLPTDSRRQRLMAQDNDDAPLLDGAPPTSSGGFHCVGHARWMPHFRSVGKVKKRDGRFQPIKSIDQCPLYGVTWQLLLE
jgi:hypothetical protein